MQRRVARVVGLCAVLVPGIAGALGLGPIQVESYLNQPLRAQIRLLSFDPGDVEQIEVRLADREAFEKAGLDRPHWLTELRFDVQARPDGSGVVEVTTRNAVREPFVDFVAEAVWPDGRVSREYVILLDPPSRPEPPRAAPPPRAPAPERAAPSPAPAEQRPGRPAAEVYGPTAANDTAWEIASQVRPDDSVSVQQTMMALLRMNPEAFIDGNVNLLRRGKTLRVPSREQILAMTREEASSAFREQTRAWRGRGRAGEPPAAEGLAAPEPAEPPAPPAEPEPPPVAEQEQPAAPSEGEPRLEILAPGEGLEARLEGLEGRPQAEQIAVLQDSLEEYKAVNRELERQNQSLEERLDRIEAQLGSLRTLLSAQDKLIAQYRGRLQEAGPGAASGAQGTSPPQGSRAAQETGAGAPVLPGDARPVQSQEPAEERWSRLLWPGVGALALVVLLAVLWWLRRRRRASSRSSHTGAGEGRNPTEDLEGVLVEVDIALAYRRLAMAESLIEGAEKVFPDAPELKAKRLELFAFRKDRERFAEYLEQSHQSIRQGAPDQWRHVQRLGRDLIPEHPLLSEDTRPPGTA